MNKQEQVTMVDAQKELPFILSKPPVVLQVVPALETGGVERGTVDIADGIVRGGGRALVASSGGEMIRELERVGAEHFYLPLSTKNPLILRKNSKRIEDLALRQNVNIIHARSRAPAWSAWWATQRTGIRFITTFHGTYGRGNVIKNYYNSIMTRGSKVIAISNFIAAHIRQCYGIPIKNIEVIPRGIDLEKFNTSSVSGERIVSLAKQWRLEDGVPVVMLPGRLTRWKGHAIFIEAIRKLKDKKFACLIVGADQGRYEYRNKLEQEVERDGMSGFVHVIDHCRDMPAAYMLSDIIVSASIEPEGFGRVVAEAQALGRMVIATNHGGAKETIIEGETGWLTEPGDANQLASTIRMALEQSNETRKKIAEKAIRHVQNKFSKELMCEKTLQLYNSVLAGASNTI